MPLVPGLQLPFGVQPVNPVAVDSWSGPYTGDPDNLQSAIDTANSSIPSAVRFKSMEVRLVVEGVSRKFWYRDGILDSDLVEFLGGTGGYEGTDTYFYVSGSTDGTNRSVFGGDVVVSGSLFDPNGLKYVTSEEDLRQGAVLFGGAAGSIAQNVDKIFWDSLNERLGIGTSSPTSTLTISGSSHITGSQYVTGSSTIVGAHDVSGSSFVTGSFYVSGTSSIEGFDYVTGSSFVTGSLTVTGSSHTSGSFFVDGFSFVTGSSFLTGSQTVSGSSYVSGSFFVEGQTRLEGSSSILGPLDMSGSITPGEDLSFDLGSENKRWNHLHASTGSFSGPVTINGDLKVLGSQTLISSSVLDVGDNIIYLNSLSDPSRFGGIYVADQNTSQTGSLLWDSATNTWIAGLKDQEVALVSGSGGANYVARWIGSNDLGIGSIYDNGTNVGIGTTFSSDKLSVNGSTSITGSLQPGVSNQYSIGSSTKVWKTVFSTEISGSLTKLASGADYLVAGNNISLSTGSNGSVTISSTASPVAGQNKQIQFNDNGSLGANSGLVYDKSTQSLTGTYIVASTGFSGSLTTLADGSPYIIAGDNITIVTGAMGEITISSTGTGGGGGGGASGGTIGEAEDGSYEDGLFTDFTPETPIGTSIDRFNEVLLALAPPPAPVLDNIDCDNSAGISAYLSFGASNSQEISSNRYYSSDTAAGFPAVDVNDLYTPLTSGENIRKGIYFGSTVINGDLNEDVPAKVYNTGVTSHVANSFGNADQGSLSLVVNGTVVHSVDLSSPTTGGGAPGAGNKSHLNDNGSGFINLSLTAPAVQSNSVEFTPFRHRTGRYQIGTADQRRGWNYARVLHVRVGTQTQTNYIEWTNDPDNISMSPTANSLTFQGNGSTFLSGVEYYTGGNLSYSVVVSNAYRYIYDLNPITFSASRTALSSQNVSYGFSNQSKPVIDTAAGETHQKVLNISTTSELTADYFLNGSVTVGVSITHPSPLKNSFTNQGQATTSQILTYNLSNTSNTSTETFRRENYRLISGSYDTQQSVTDPINAWDSQVHINGGVTEYADGLQVFNQQLLSPKNTLNGGNFSSLTNAPPGNPNYSSVSGKRTFYRWFKNTTGASQYDLSLTMNGSSTLVSSLTSLDSSKIRVYVKIPDKTGWLDVSLPFSFGASLADGAGVYIDNAYLDFDNTLNSINYLNLGSLTIDSNEYIVLKIEAESAWTGNVSLINVTFGAGTGTLTPVPDLSEIDSDNTGISAKLSFGSSRSIDGYSNSGTAAGFSAVDLNGVYQSEASNGNLRRGIFSTIQNIEGDLNESVAAASLSYVNNAFSDANRGILKLEVNGSVIHTVDLSTSVGSGDPGSGTGTSLNARNSGFINLSNWGPSMFSNGVPRYTEFQRTGRYRVTPSDQSNGWNYLRVIHSVDSVNRVTNYVEWINDPDDNALSSSGNGLSIFGDDTFSYVSGVKYFNSPSGSIETRVSNIYKNVYSASPSAITIVPLTNASSVRITQNGQGITSTKTTNASQDSLQALNTNPGSQNEVLHVTGTINFTQSKSLPGTLTTAYGCSGAMSFVHPYKTSLTIPTQSTTNLLVWTPTDSSNSHTEERFDGELYRLVDDSYTTQANVTDINRKWNSQISMNDQVNYPKYASGLLVYDTYLVAPQKGGTLGDFRNHKEGGSIESPAGNVDYRSSSLTVATRNYYRSFANNTSSVQSRVRVVLYGDATLVAKTGANAAALGANKRINVHVGIPGKTGLLDIARDSEGSFANDDDGGLFGNLISNITMAGTANVCTFSGPTVFGTASPGGSERIVLRVTAHKDWTGYLDRIVIVWGG